MSTQFTNRQWRLPNNENKDKQSNYSMSFDGGSDYVTIGSVPTLFISSWSISFWFKAPSIGNTNGTIISRYRSANATGDFEITSASGQLYIETGGGFPSTGAGAGTNQIRTTSTSLDDGNWHHIAFSLDYSSGTSTRSLYVDGSLDVSDSTTTPAEWVSQTENLVFGVLIPPTNSQYNGFIDSIAIYNYALSSSQVTTLYGSSSTGIGNPMSLSPKPVAYYPLGDQDAFNGADYLVPNSSLKDYVFNFGTFTSNDRIVINDTFDTIITGTNFTISSWINLDSIANELKFIFTNDSLQLAITNKITTYLRGATGYFLSPFNSNTTLSTGKWYNVVFVKSGSDYTYYLNGSPDGTVNNSTSVVNSSQTTSRIGMYFQNSTYGFDGEISNLQIFNTALPATGSNSVETLYNNGSPLTSMTGFSSLQGWWKLDASDTYDSSTGNWTITDHSTNSNDGTSSGMTQANLVQSDLSFTSGYSPYALDFDSASSDYIQINNGSSLTNGFSELTVSVWANFSTVGTSQQQIITKDDTNQRSFNLRKLSSGVNFLVSTDGTSSSQTLFYPSSSITIGEWYHFVGIYDGSKLLLYVNGVLIDDSVSLTGSLQNTTSGFFIGSYGFNNSYTFDGSLSNASIWNTALTSAQVSEIYSEGVPQNLNNHSAYSNLVSWWQLGSNSSFNTNWTVLDEKGSSNGVSSNMGEDAIVDGVGSYANGLSSGMGGDEVIGDAPYSTANALSVNMDVEDRVTDTPS